MALIKLVTASEEELARRVSKKPTAPKKAEAKKPAAKKEK
jgi:hypothetical protein